jgi:acyl-CoA reductase-like NAD-dependent aldehyde dehydrogenase
VTTSKGAFLANAAKASRKDARDAVVAARAAFPGWSGATGYNRGQVLYRIAELLEGRRAQFVDELRSTDGLTEAAAGKQVDAAIDAWVWYAGWADKYLQVAGNGNPVSGPYFNISTPEPTGVVAVVAPATHGLLGLVSVVAPIIVSGNTVVVVASESSPLSAISLAEVMATSDVPGGVVNVLTGSAAELAPWLAGHADVNALDLAGATRSSACCRPRPACPLSRSTASPSSPRRRRSGTRKPSSSGPALVAIGYVIGGAMVLIGLAGGIYGQMLRRRGRK